MVLPHRHGREHPADDRQHRHHGPVPQLLASTQQRGANDVEVVQQRVKLDDARPSSDPLLPQGVVIPNDRRDKEQQPHHREQQRTDVAVAGGQDAETQLPLTPKWAAISRSFPLLGPSADHRPQFVASSRPSQGAAPGAPVGNRHPGQLGTVGATGQGGCGVGGGKHGRVRPLGARWARGHHRAGHRVTVGSRPVSSCASRMAACTALSGLSRAPAGIPQVPP